ncbi:MAG: glycosyltransferase [Bauldia sp.]
MTRRAKTTPGTAPARPPHAAAPDYDVAIIADMTVPGEMAFRIAGEVEALAAAGRSVALIHLRSAVSRSRIAPDLQGCVAAGIADPVQPTEGVSAGRAILHGPQYVDAPTRLRGLRTPGLTVVADRTPDYDATALDGGLRRIAPVLWAPTAAVVRATLRAGHPGLALAGDDWPLPPGRAGTAQPLRPSARLVIGQVGGEGAFPASLHEMRTVFPPGGGHEVRFLGAPPPAIGLLPDDWRLIATDDMSVAQFLRRLDAFLHYPADPNVPIDAIAAWCLANGKPVLMEPALRSRYGAGPLYAEPGDAAEALRRYVIDPVIANATRRAGRAGARRMTAAWPAEPASAPRPPRDERRRILFVTSNGTGLGHVSRLLAIARHLDDFEPVFVTMAQAVSSIEAFGFTAEYLPSQQYTGADPLLWDGWFRAELELLIDTYDAAGIVYDGNGPSHGLVGAAGSRGQCGLAWIRGGMAGRASVPHIANSLHFDLIVEPGEAATADDFGETVRRRGEVELVEPILLLDPSELLSRKEAAKALGLDPKRPAALIQLGTGSNRDVVTLIDRIVAGLAGSGTQLAIAEWSSAAPLPPLWPEAVIVSGHPLAQYYRAFDFTVAAAGYNTFHEIIAYGVPAIFVANGHHAMDDQLARARYAEANELALALDERDLTELPEMLKVMTSEPARAFLRENCLKRPAPTGAKAAARLIRERLRGGPLVRRV